LGLAMSDPLGGGEGEVKRRVFCPVSGVGS